MNQVEMAVSQFRGGQACSQAVLSAFAEPLGMDHQTAVRIAAGFGGGMGCMAQTCGAVTGAFMVLGLRYESPQGNDRAARQKVYELVRQFADRFTARTGSVVCRDLLGCDISTPEGLETARQRECFTTVCPRFVQVASEILEEMLHE